MDTIIRQAHLRGRESTWDIGITGDRIAAVAEHLPDEATTEVDAAGNLALPTYVNGHIHLDKCFLQETMRPNKDYTFGECLELTWEHKARYTTEDILERAGRAIREGLLNGTTVFRAFADVDSIGQLRGLEGLLALREQRRDQAHIEVVTFPQEGILRDPGTAELLEEAMRLGADVVGGLPWFELLDEDARTHIDFCFALARRYNKDIHMLIDDTDNPLSRSLEYLAVKTLREGYQGRVSASHCGALAAYNEVHAHKVMELLKQAEVSISSNPHISLVVQGRYDQEPVRRGITRVKQLWQHGVNVFSSQDDVADPFYPFGRNDQQEVAAYLCHTAHLAAPSEIEAAFDFVTYNAARALRLPDYGLEPGCKADLNVLAAPTLREVLRLQQPPRWVLRGGKVLASTQVVRTLAP
ncbi:MAG TPA: amidohydrolase family protein [Ktedonobacteraceae bacterium]|nr:amidohydrolase family protein [Ktedonobacteraceae bacterium]